MILIEHEPLTLGALISDASGAQIVMPQEFDSNLSNSSQFKSMPVAPKIENIEIIELLGKGGMSLVYKARQKQLDRVVAVKVLSNSAFTDEAGIKRFQKEAKLTSTLDHPNIVKTISFGVSEDGLPYLVMEYIEGRSLAEELRNHKQLKLQRFKDVFLPALSALNSAHQSGVVHRDIKPGNIMLCESPSGEQQVKIVDFGIAKVFGEREGDGETKNLTKSGAVLGSPAYMSPEQCRGQDLDGRSDLYSMACVMYETLCGEPPYTGDSLLEIMQKHSSAPPPTVSDLSRKIDIRRELAQVTIWGLAKDPTTRPQTASEFARKLNEVLERITLDKAPKLKNAPSKPQSLSKKLKWGAGLAAAGVAIASLFLFLNHDTQQKKNDALKSMTFAPKKRDAILLARLLAREDISVSLATSLSNQAEMYESKGDLKNANSLWKRSLYVNEKLFGKNSLELARFLADYATFLFRQEHYSEAEPFLKRCLSIREELLEETNPVLLSTHLSMGNCYFQQNKNAPAEMHLKHVLKMNERLGEADNRVVIETMDVLSRLYLRQGKCSQAKPQLQRTVSFFENQPEVDHRKLIDICNRLAGCDEYLGNSKDAEKSLKKYLQNSEIVFGKNSPQLCNALQRLGACYLSQKEYAQAETAFERLIGIDEQNAEDKNVTLTDDLNALASCYLKENKKIEANAVLKRIGNLSSKTKR